jgi:hypothetical protein
MTEETKKPSTPAPEQTPGAGQPDLTVQDLQALKAIIDVATKRGAFQANELEVVGKTYNKLNAFLDAVTPKNQGDAPAQAPADQKPTEAPAQPAEAPKE